MKTNLTPFTLTLLALVGAASWLLPGRLPAQVPPPNGPGEALSLDDAFYHYVDVPDDIWFSGDFTVEAWVNVRSYNSWSRLLDFGNVDLQSGEGSDNVVVALSDGITGKPHFNVVRIYDTSHGITAPNALPLNQWTHLACVLSGSTGTIYVNGSAPCCVWAVTLGAAIGRRIGTPTRSSTRFESGMSRAPHRKFRMRCAGSCSATKPG